MQRNEAISRARAALENSVADQIQKAYEEGLREGAERVSDNHYKARLHTIVNELPDDLGRIMPDLVTILQWMADPERRYQQGGTGEALKPGGSTDEHTIGVAPGIAAPFHHYFLVFSPKPYRRGSRDG